MGTPAPLVFKKSKIKVFTIENDSGEEDSFCIKCFSGKLRAQYMAEISKDSKMVTDDKGNTSFEFKEGFKDLPSLLLIRCIHYYDPQSKKIGDLVDEQVLLEWDSFVLDALVPLANEICKLNVDDDESAKNE